MKYLFIGFLLLGAALGHDDDDHHDDDHHHHHDHDHDNEDDDLIKDYNRACPSGFSYLGEVDAEHFGKDFWTQGERTPTYSCYSLHQGPFDWTAASQKCFDQEAQLISVNNPFEENILTTNKTREWFDNVWPEDGVITSGISFKAGDWVWFGAGEEVDSYNITVEEEDTNNTDTKCIKISWDEDQDMLIYTAVPCADQHDVAMCEVRVYTQTWYYWATTNWLSILFMFTLILLILTSCVTVQMYTSRPKQRMQRQSMSDAGVTNLPPPYTPHDTMTSNTNSGTRGSNKYTEKGKEMLAKIVFYKQSDDKQKLTP